MATWFDIQGCAFWSHKDSEWAVILFIKLSPFEWQNGLNYKAQPCRCHSNAILKDIGVVIVIGLAYCMIYCLVTLLQYPFSILNILKFEFPSLFPKLESNQYEKLK